MKSIPELRFGFSDAENYRRKENKELFNHIFVRTQELDRLLDPSIYFLMGDKGTGKTAYAVYLANNDYKDTLASLKYIRETEYQRFVALKQEKHLDISDYTHIWKVILYLLLAEFIRERHGRGGILNHFTKFGSLMRAIDEFYKHAFSPEIINAITFAVESSKAAKLITEFAEAGAEETKTRTFNEVRFQVNLMFIQRSFQEALRTLKLMQNYILFIDGIDIRPTNIPYNDYLECVKGLVNAVWSVNNDFFASIKDSPGRIRVVLLTRPDIFDSLQLQNRNTKIRDNSVLLDWRTTYPEYRTSKIFGMADQLLSAQQEESLQLGQAWDYYFPFERKSTSPQRKTDPSFISFLRFSYYRPRDIITMLGILQDHFKQTKRDKHEVLQEKDFDHRYVRRVYADYLLGEIKDQISFYHTSREYELFLKFFEYLGGRNSFTYREYLSAFAQFDDFISQNYSERPKFFESADHFLQLLYELNVICYIEFTRDEQFMRWCFRERSHSDISPKVRAETEYKIHYGIAKALNTGKRIIKL